MWKIGGPISLVLEGVRIILQSVIILSKLTSAKLFLNFLKISVTEFLILIRIKVE